MVFGPCLTGEKYTRKRATGAAPASLLTPGSFSVDEALSFSDFIYFSFTTLTTSGYGDIVPVGGLVRAVASLEMVVGVLYIAVLVARLVAVLGRERISDAER
ncbi:MAG: potassium channel family protein [Methanomicrobiales archaeon]